VTNPTNAATIPVTVDFSEAITGFDATDVTVANGTLSNFTANSTQQFTFVVTPTADGDVTVTIGPGKATDQAGNGNIGASCAVVVDRAAPTVTVSSTASNPTATNPIPITVTFNEAVTGFDAGDLTISNGTA